MADARAAGDVLTTLVLCGVMGMVGQGARTIVGLKKLSDSTSADPTQADTFAASRIFVGFMIGFVAGVAAGLALKVLDAGTAINGSLLLGLAAAGYAGTDVVEGFAQTLGKTKVPPLSWDNITVSAPVPAPAPHPPAPGPQPPLGGLSRQLDAARQFAGAIDASARKHGLDPAIVYAIGSRESAWGLALHPPGPTGTGDKAARSGPTPLPPDGGGWGRGLMQIDYGAWEFARSGDWQDPVANIEFGCGILAASLEKFSKLLDDKEEALRAGIAAYNCGDGGVQRALRLGVDVDQFTTGHNYSADTLRRADWFRQHLASPTV